MKKVITYGTYDLLHFGHIRLLERAKALGDYLVVGVTAEDFDKSRGKINVEQSLIERMEAVKATGIADEVIIEEYEGQKIDDILRYDIDIFAIGSDWEGTFDYLKEYCQVVYLERTMGVSSSEIRAERLDIKLGLLGDDEFLNKVEKEGHFVNGINITALCTRNNNQVRYSKELSSLPYVTNDYDKMLDVVDAVYIMSKPGEHYDDIKRALQKGKHVIAEPPMTLSVVQWEELHDIAQKFSCVLMDAIRTAYSTAYHRMLLLVKSGVIGKVMSIDVSNTSLRNDDVPRELLQERWNSINSWGPNALLPVFQVFGTDYKKKIIASHFVDRELNYDNFTMISFIYPEAVASIKVGKGVKSEGQLIISGTTGYIYVPAPWWKMDYFEIRREDPTQNKRYFYQLDGEGIRYELVSFAKAIREGRTFSNIENIVSKGIVHIIEDFYNGNDLVEI